MKRIYFLAVFLFTLITANVNAQNVLVAGASVGNGTYADLGSAFTAINSGSQTGANIIISITGNTTETATATLNAGTWNSMTIAPSGGAARTISGNVLGALIDFNGADKISIDGLNSGGNSLTIDNQNTGTTSTVRFSNDAHLIAMQRTTILGANTSTLSGTVYLALGTVTGNDSLTFSTCTIDASSAGFPVNGVFSLGNTTTGMENSVIAFNACNIANYFSPTVITAGLLASTGNTDWIVQNCRFYQSALRTYTTANTHRAIQFQSGNNNTISGNTIGYATAAGTGVYAMTSTVATRFIAIDLAVGIFTASNVNGNTFTAYTLGTSSGAATTNGIICGINITAGNVNVGNTVPNTIGAATGVNSIVATATTTNGMVVGINSSSTGTIVISNNIIGSLSSSGTTAAIAGNITGINVSGAAASMTITGNTIGNSTVDNLRGGTNGLTTGSSQGYGIFLTSTSAVAVVSNNTIQNLTTYGTGASGFVRGIATATTTNATASLSITGNTITALTTSGALTGIGSALCSAEGIHMLSATGVNISLNTISNIANINTATTNMIVAGISIGASTVTTTNGTSVFRNTIYNLRNAGTGTTATSPPIVAGIAIRSGNAPTAIYNNMISLGNGQTTNTAFTGIYGNHGSTPNPTTVNIYHNTINIEGTVTAGALATFCVHRGDYTATARIIPWDVRNNILTNTRTGGTGQHFAIGNNYNVAAVQPTGWTSNYNVLNANAATVGYWGAALSFSGWQTTAASDLNSLSGITVNYMNSASNLHLNMNVTPTAMESGGTTISLVTNDIDNDARPGPVGSVNGGAFAPDLGADEFDGVYLDALPPVITYTPLTFTCATSDRTLTATIVDYSGVPTIGVLQPRIYFRKNANAWVSTQGTFISGNPSNGTWTFTISSAAMGGIAIGDNISYYVIAQDASGPTPNIGSNPSGGLVATNVNTVTTAPTTPNSYVIGGTLSGTYTVGASGTFPTLTAAINTYNYSCLSGAVVFSLIDATYPSETFPITINANPNASSVNTLTIKPAVGVTPLITGSTATAMIVLNGADYININGSNGSVVNSTCPRTTASRDLTIENTNTSTASAVISLQTSGTGDAATNNVIMNSNITGNGGLTTGVAVNISGPTIGSGVGANANSNNQIVNNFITKAQVGIFSAGVSASVRNMNNSYNLNDLNASGTNAIGRVGIMILYEGSPSVLSNNIGNISNGATQDVMGIAIGTNAASNSLTTGADVINATVSGNTIFELLQTNTYSAVGINIGAAPSGTINVTNNIINRVFCNGTGGDFAGGIYYGGGAGALNIYHNTINVSGAALTGATQPNMAIGINGSTPTVDIRNNVLVCGGSNGFDGNTGIGLAYTSTFGNYANLTSNYNDIFVSGTLSCVGRVGGLAVGIPLTALTDWQNETGRDANSVSVVPAFVSISDPHLVAGSNPFLEDAALPISVTNDIDCQTRNTCAVDMGADEFGTPREANVTGNSISIIDGDITPVNTDFTDFDSTSVCNGTVVRSFIIQNNGTSPLNISGVTITGANAADFTITTTPATNVNAAGTTTLGITFDPSAAGLSTATVTISTNDCDEASYDFAIQGRGTQIAIAASSQTDATCNAGSNGSATITVANGIPAYTYSWTSGGTAATETGLAAGTYTVTATDANGCTASQTFTITEPTAITSSVSQNNPLCNGGNNGDATVTSTGGTGTHTYSWSSGGNAATETGLSAGTYTVTITDANGCTALDSVTITEPTAITSSVTQNDPLCNGGTGDATVSSTGGTGTYTYSWSSGGNAATETGLAAGTFTVTITDANGCTAVDSVTITQPAAISSSITSTSVLCNGGSDGTATVSSTGGTGTHTYSWSSGGNATTETGLAAGTFTVTITDANGCTSLDSVTITEPPVLAYFFVSSNPTTCGGTNGSIDITPGGGTPGYVYLWSNSQTSEDLTGLSAGTYSISITDANGCSLNDVITISDPNPPVVSVSITQDTVCTLDGSFALTGGAPSGGTYTGPGISAGSFNPGSANAGYNVVTYAYTDPNTGCSASNTDSIYVDPCAGIIENANAGNASVYPNPSYGIFNIELNQNAQVIIYNSLGQIVSNEFMNTGRHEFSLEGKASGIYSVHIISGNEQQVIRLVKE